MNETSAIIKFYQGEGTDSEGRTLVEVLSFDNGELETNHNYVQWLFPLNHQSAFNPTAPILTHNDIKLFINDSQLREKYLVSLNKMLSFYGITLADDCQEVKMHLSATFSQQKINWVTLGNHNFLRLTRILTSLNILGFPDHAKAMFEILETIYLENTTAIGTVTWNFWKQAAA